MVRLEGYEKRKPSQLSGGQRQRVALARALVNRPRVLLLDEPLGALDLKLREEMQIELKAIQQAVGITFIYVTHDQEEALTMSDRLAVFNQGRIEQIGAPAEVYERPADAVRGRFRRDVQSAAWRGGRARSWVRPAPSRSGPRRSGWPPPTRRSDRRDVGDRGRARRRLPRPRYPLCRDPRRGRGARRHPTELVDVLDRGARPGRKGCPARVEAAASTPHRGWGVNVEEERECVSEA